MSQKRNRKQEKEIYICGLILLGILLFWLAAERLLGLEFSLPPCVFHSLTGLYCPGCGGTRAVRYLLHGQLGKSLFYNPVVLYGAIVLVAEAVTWILSKILKKPGLYLARYNLFLLIGLAVLGANWIFKNYMLIAKGIALIP